MEYQRGLRHVRPVYVYFYISAPRPELESTLSGAKWPLKPSAGTATHAAYL